MCCYRSGCLLAVILINKLNAMRSEVLPIFLSLFVVYMFQVVYCLFQKFFSYMLLRSNAFMMSDRFYNKLVVRS